LERALEGLGVVSEVVCAAAQAALKGARAKVSVVVAQAARGDGRAHHGEQAEGTHFEQNGVEVLPLLMCERRESRRRPNTVRSFVAWPCQLGPCYPLYYPIPRTMRTDASGFGLPLHLFFTDDGQGQTNGPPGLRVGLLPPVAAS
jgi:hypothetical protein